MGAKFNKFSGGVKMSRKFALLAVLVLAFAFAAGAAYAANPDDATEAATVIDPTTGVSRWSYKDAADTTAKTEGGYAAFESGTLYTTNPHGGYDSTTNKCKVCHAVHRAEGAYYLLRSDTQDDACSYCHIGGSAHSRKVVYDLAGTIYTPNGHTIGASSVIPDSSVYQWLEEVELETVDGDGNEVTATIEVRRYYERRNKMFRYARHHGQSGPGNSNNRGGYGRIGPLALRCMNCHQPHNATDMIWRPYGFVEGQYGTSFTDYGTRLLHYTGYKLLRRSPSGSIIPALADGSKVTQVLISPADGFPTTKTAWDVQIDRLAVWPLGGSTGIRKGLIVWAPEDATIGPHNTGLPASINSNGFTSATIWTDWSEIPEHEFHGGPYRDPSVVSPFSLSVWCADCHNLNIGYWTEAEPEEHAMEFGFHQHTARTHPAPYTGAYNGPAQCYSCHRNDMPLTNSGEDEQGFIPGTTGGKLFNPAHDYCEQCHFGTFSYANVRFRAVSEGLFAHYDFPHSGGSNDVKMLGRWTAFIDENGTMVTTRTTITFNNLDAVCKRCHPGIGVNH